MPHSGVVSSDAPGPCGRADLRKVDPPSLGSLDLRTAVDIILKDLFGVSGPELNSRLALNFEKLKKFRK